MLHKLKTNYLEILGVGFPCASSIQKKKKKDLNRNPVWKYEGDYSEQALWSKTNSMWKAENQCYL